MAQRGWLSCLGHNGPRRSNPVGSPGAISQLLPHGHSNTLKCSGGSIPSSPTSFWGVTLEVYPLCLYFCRPWLTVPVTTQIALLGTSAVHTCCLRVTEPIEVTVTKTFMLRRYRLSHSWGAHVSGFLEHLVPEYCLASSLVLHNTRNLTVFCPEPWGASIPDAIPYQSGFPESKCGG